jgi:hypothetical protein
MLQPAPDLSATPAPALAWGLLLGPEQSQMQYVPRLQKIH